MLLPRAATVNLVPLAPDVCVCAVVCNTAYHSTEVATSFSYRAGCVADKRV